MPACSVIIVNWNGRHHLEGCLCSLERQTFRDFDAILVDNGSTDGSPEFVRERFPWVRLLVQETNRGFCGGNNIGIRCATSQYIVVLNNDTEADPNWLGELVRAAETQRVDFCASQIRRFDRRDLLDAAGDYLTVSGAAGNRGHLQPATRFTAAEEVFGACAAAALYRRSMLDRIGVFDEDFFLAFEDVDLSFRARLAGYHCLYVPTAIVYHKRNASIGQYSRTYVYYGQRNLEFVFFKNMPLPLLLKYLPAHIVYNVLAFFFFAAAGQVRPFLRAKGAALGRLPAVFRKRRQVQALRVLDTKTVDAWLTRKWLARRWTEKGVFGEARLGRVPPAS